MSGNQITEVITGAIGGETSKGSKIFKTVTSVTPSATTGSGNIEIGHESQPVFLMYLMNKVYFFKNNDYKYKFRNSKNS